MLWSVKRMPSTQTGDELVSVIIPAYNASETIEATLSSVCGQTYAKLDIIVIDDGSHDDTAEVVRRLSGKDPRIRLLRKANAGLAAARNTGLEHARGDFVAPLDADDLWHPTKIEKQVNVFRHTLSSVGLVYCWARGVDQRGQVLFDFPSFCYTGDVFAALILFNFIASGSPLFRRSLALEVGGYDVSLASRGATTCEDLKFNLDIAERCGFDLVPEFLFAYTMRPGSMSKSATKMHESRCLIVDEARMTHPELPSRLFRWARALNARACSQVHIEEGQFREALKFVIKAAMIDPLGVTGPHARRTLVSGLLGYTGLKSRYKYLVRQLEHLREPWNPALSGPRCGCSFFEVDPTKPFGCPSPSWASKRFRHVGEFRSARYQLAG
jgi:glycosyltransferase involved in cell wall biosynthesis